MVMEEEEEVWSKPTSFSEAPDPVRRSDGCRERGEVRRDERVRDDKGGEREGERDGRLVRETNNPGAKSLSLLVGLPGGWDERIDG